MRLDIAVDVNYSIVSKVPLFQVGTLERCSTINVIESDGGKCLLSREMIFQKPAVHKIRHCSNEYVVICYKTDVFFGI